MKGLTKENPGKSCRDILDTSRTTSKTGLYWIQPDGDSFPVQSYCDMSFQDGGWTLASYGYVATTAYGQFNDANKNIPNMNHPNGYTWHPNKRNNSQGVIALQHGAVNLARGAKYMIMAAGTFPTGYGFSPVNAQHGTWNKGPFFPSIHTGDRPAGGCSAAKPYAPDVAKGCPNYAHYGWHSLYTTQKTGQTSIWFKKKFRRFLHVIERAVVYTNI